jgi:hypothetical protein
MEKKVAKTISTKIDQYFCNSSFFIWHKFLLKDHIFLPVMGSLKEGLTTRTCWRFREEKRLVLIVIYNTVKMFWQVLINVTIIDNRGRNRIIVGFTTTYAISASHHWRYEFVSGLRQVGGFLRVLQFSPQIKLTAML